MGYYSDIDLCVGIKKERVSEFREKQAKYIKDHDEDNNLKWYLENMTVSDDGDIELAEYNAKFYDMDDWLLFMKGFLTDGTIEMRGEDNAQWGWYVDKDLFYDMIHETKRGDITLVTDLERVMLEATNARKNNKGRKNK